MVNAVKMKIRKESEKDFSVVFELIEKAFRGVKHSDHREQYLVERLRNSEAFIPELSLVAVCDNMIVGHILVTKIKITNERDTYSALTLAPVSVLPAYQGKGIGGQLILEAHKVARVLGFGSIVLLGHEKYYPRFGYKQADQFGIQFPFDAPKANCMVVELIENTLESVYGIVQYPKAFYE